MLRGETGGVFLEILVAAIILWAGFYSMSGVFSKTQNNNGTIDRKVTAEAYASELLDFFRALSAASVKTYLETNPILGAAGAPYYLCSHINLLDRSSGNILNADPLADLPISILTRETPAATGNRFYQVQIINLSTMTIRKDLCDQTAKQIYLYGTKPQVGETRGLGQFDHFLVTVGVSWQPPAEKGLQMERVTLNTVIPD